MSLKAARRGECAPPESVRAAAQVSGCSGGARLPKSCVKLQTERMRTCPVARLGVLSCSACGPRARISPARAAGCDSTKRLERRAQAPKARTGLRGGSGSFAGRGRNCAGCQRPRLIRPLQPRDRRKPRVHVLFVVLPHRERSRRSAAPPVRPPAGLAAARRAVHVLCERERAPNVHPIGAAAFSVCSTSDIAKRALLQAKHARSRPFARAAPRHARAGACRAWDARAVARATGREAVMKPMTLRFAQRRGLHATLLRAACLAALCGVAQRAAATPCPPAGAPRSVSCANAAPRAASLTHAAPRSLGAHACRRGRARLRRRRGRSGAVRVAGGRCRRARGRRALDSRHRQPPPAPSGPRNGCALRRRLASASVGIARPAADALPCRLRTGAVVTVAGAGIPGFADGAAPASLFSAPRGVAADAGGTVYVAGARRFAPAALTPALPASRAGPCRHRQRAHPRRQRLHRRREHARRQRQPHVPRRRGSTSHVSHSHGSRLGRRHARTALRC
jgi:hypothetical protein